MSEPKPSPWAAGAEAAKSISDQGTLRAQAMLKQMFDDGLDYREQTATVGVMMSALAAANSMFKTDESAEAGIKGFFDVMVEQCLKKRQMFRVLVLSGDPETIALVKRLAHGQPLMSMVPL